MFKTFTKQEIININKKYPWNNTIKFSSNNNNNNDNDKYILKATGECDLTYGRTYIAIKNDK